MPYASLPLHEAFVWGFWGSLWGSLEIPVRISMYIIPPPVSNWQLVKFTTISRYILEKAPVFINFGDILVVSQFCRLLEGGWGMWV
jgi:hypothetical protein